MEWDTQMKVINKEMWEEESVFLFGPDDGRYCEVQVLCRTSTKKGMYGTEHKMIYEIRSGFVGISTLVGTNYTYDINRRTIDVFSEHNGNTSYTWWCSEFKKDTLHDAMELAHELKEFLANIFKTEISPLIEKKKTV